MAALLDEAMGCACWLVGRTVLAKKIEVEFKRPLRLLTTVVIEARLVRSSGRRCYAEGRLTLAGGEECASSTGLFIELPLERLASLVGSERGPLD